MEIATLGIKVDSSQVKNAKGDVENLTRSGKTADDRFKSFTNTLKGVAGALAIGATFRAVISATVEQERVTRQLEAALEATGGAAGLARDELLSMASELQKVTTFGDETVISAQAMLLTFKQIGQDVFPEALEAILDVSTAMGTDLKSAALQVGKALNDPVLGASALSEAGIQFTAVQKEVIASLVETGRTADAQRIILEELETQFGGSARAARDTLGGAIQSLKNAFGDLLEGDSGGEGVRGAKDSIEELIKLLEDPNTQQAFGEITSAVVDITSAAARGAVAFADFGKSLGTFLATRGGTDFGLHDIDGMVAKLTKLQDQMGLMSERGQTNTPMFRSIEAEFDRISIQLDRAYEQAESFGGQKIVTPEQTAGVKAGADAVRTLTAEEIELEKQRKIAAEAAQKRWESNQGTIESLELEAATLNMTASEAKLYELALNGADAAQRAAAESALALIDAHKIEADAMKEQTEAAKAYHALMAEMDNAVHDAEIARLLERQQQKREIIQAALDAEYITKHEHDLRMIELEQQTAEERARIADEFSARQAAAAVSMMADVLSITSTQVGQMQGLFDEASGIGKAFFFVSQTLAAANAVIAGLQASMAIRVAYAQMAAMSGTAAPGILAAGEVHANVAAGMGAVTGGMIMGQALASFDGGGFTGFGARSGGVDGKGGFPAILHPNETVIDHAKGQGMGNNVTVNLIADTARAGEVNTTEAEDGSMQVDAFVADIFGDGPRARALEGAYGLSRVGR